MGDHLINDHIVGPLGEAHLIPVGQVVATAPAALAVWWVHIPGQPMTVAHLDANDNVEGIELMIPAFEDAMDTFSLGLITLADVPGVPPAHRKWPWVTHELIVTTIDLTAGPVTHTTPLPWPLLDPVNLSVQFQVNDDEEARHVLYDIAYAVVHGMLPPEVQAFVPERQKMMTLAPLHLLWQDVVATTAEHVRTGGTHVDPHPRG